MNQRQQIPEKMVDLVSHTMMALGSFLAANCWLNVTKYFSQGEKSINWKQVIVTVNKGI